LGTERISFGGEQLEKRSKTQQGVVKTKFVDVTTAAAIEAWRALAGINSEVIFRGVAKSGLGVPLSTKGVSRAVQRKEAGA
jgi:hypothetical protein